MSVCMLAACAPDQPQALTPESQPDSILHRVADSLYLLAQTAPSPRQALELHERSLKTRLLCQDSGLPLAYNYWKVGVLLLNDLKTEAADESLESARKLAEQHHAPLDTLTMIYLNQASAKREMMDVPSATSLTLHALQLVRTLAPNRRDLLSRCLSAVASSNYAGKKYHEAISQYKQAARLTADSSFISAFQFNTALVYRSMGKLDSCMYWLDKALEIRIRLSGLKSLRTSAILINKGDAYKSFGRTDSALHNFKRALQIRLALNDIGVKHIMTAGAFETLGDLFHDMGNYDSAVVYRQRQLTSLLPTFNSQDVRDNPHPTEQETSMLLVDYLVDKASTLRQISTRDSLRSDLMKLSLETYLLADSVFAVFQSRLTYDDPQFSQLAAEPVPYDEMMDVSVRLHRLSGDATLVEGMFHIMERSRAAVLKSALRRAEAYSEVGLPAYLLKREKELLQGRSVLVDALSHPNNETSQDSIGEAIFRVDQEYHRLQDVIAAERPNYSMLRYSEESLKLSRLQDLMKEKESLWIEFLWGKEKLFILSAGSQKATIREVIVDDSLISALHVVASEVETFSEESLKRDHYKEFVRQSKWLFDKLLAPELSQLEINRLVISPSGVLVSFPFETLIIRVPEGEETNYRLPYLVSEYSVSYHYSSSFLNKQHNRARHGDKLLAIGYDGAGAAVGGRALIADLPGTRAELNAIQQVMSNGGNSYLLDDDASESAFKQGAEKFNLLHLAIHGFGDTINAMQSHLVFRNTRDTTNDGKLYAHELYTLDLRNVDLTVLSACESGVGKLQAGEGMMSIARGFAYAGCPSLVISLWKISDKTSSTLMSDFYSELSAGLPIDEALALAKRKYISEVNMFNSHPYYWGAFLVVGETAEVSGHANRWLGATIVVIAGALLLVALAAWRKPASRKSKPHVT